MNSFFRELKQRKVYRVALGLRSSCLARNPDKRDSHARLPCARVDLADLYHGGKARRSDKCPYRQWWHACHGRYAAANTLDDVMPDGSIRVLAFLLQRAFPF
jgi:hypothetical protein